MNSKKRDWIIALGYVVLIYATLEVARFPLAFLRSHGVLRYTLGVLFLLAAVAVLTMVFKQKPFPTWKLPVLLVIFMAYLHGAKFLQTPEEQVHFFEYGLVGLFFNKALEHDWGQNLRSWLLALTLSSLAGWLDEILQGLSPHRHYDNRDVILNAVSAAMGLTLYFVVRFSKSPRKIDL